MGKRVYFFVASVGVSMAAFAPLSSCGFGADDSLDVERAPGDGPLAELRRRQLLRFTQGEEERTVALFPDQEPLFPEDEERLGQSAPEALMGRNGFLEILTEECLHELHESATDDAGEVVRDATRCIPPGAEGIQDSECNQTHCALEVSLCRANLLLELADQVTTKTFFSWKPEAEQIVVRPQDSATKAALHELVPLELAQEGTGALRDVQGSLYGLPSSGCGETFGEDSVSVASSMATLINEFYHLMVEAGFKSIDSYIALSDGEFGSGAGVEDGAMRKQQIRFHAAHTLIGGDLGIRGGMTNAAFCTAPELDSDEKRALELLRESGVSPRAINAIPQGREVGLPGGGAIDSGDSIDIEELLEGFMLEGAPAADSVRARLSRVWGLVELDPSDPDALTLAQMLEGLGLDLEDFITARAYLAQENKAFARSERVLLPPRPAPGGGEIGDRHAGTVNPPTPPSWLYYGTLARFRESPRGFEEQFQNTDRSLRSLLGEFARRTIDIVRRDPSVSSDEATVAIRADFRRGLLPLSLTAQREVPAELLVSDDPSARYIVLFHHGIPSEDLVLVQSAEALSCALTGEIEGVRCTWDDVDPVAQLAARPERIENETADAATERRKFTTFTAWPIPEDTELSEGTRQFFIVRRRNILTRPEDSGRANVTGDYEAFASGYLYDGGGYSSDELVTPGLDRRAGEALAPSTAWCTHPHASCIEGVSFDERLPLEDELTDDGDEFENSWRRYLALARQAADEADALGEQVIANRLEMDIRAEQALAEVEDICGTAINIDDLEARTGGSCDEDTPCPTGEECVAGICMADQLTVATDEGEGEATLSDDPNQNRLKECLGNSKIIPFVGLGSRELCLWAPGGDPNRICEYVNGENDNGMAEPCPSFADAGECTDPDGPGTDYEVIPPPPSPPNEDDQLHSVGEKQLLGYFDPDEAEITSIGGSPPCAEWRRFRRAIDDSSTSDSDILTRWTLMARRGFFTFTNLRRFARNIRWDAGPRDFSTLYIEGRTPVSTGHFVAGPSENWPCAPSMDGTSIREIPAGCDEGNGLFCEPSIECRDVQTRASFNQRLSKAAFVARFIAGLSAEGFRVPTRYRDGIPTGIPHFQFTYDGSLLNEWFTNDAPSDQLFCQYEGGALSALLWSDVWPRDVSVGDRRGQRELPTVCANRERPNNEARSIRFEELSDSSEGTAIEMRKIAANLLLDFNRRRRGAQRSGFFDFFTGRSGSVSLLTPQNSELNFLGKDKSDRKDAPRDILPGFGSILEGEAVLDGMELLCEAASQRAPACGATPPRINSVAQLSDARSYLECIAGSLEASAAKTVIAKMPKRAFDALRQESTVGSFPSTGGAYGEQVALLRIALIDLASVPSDIASQLRGLGFDMDRLRIALARVENQKDQSRINFKKEVGDRITSCAVAVANAVGGGPARAAAGAVAAAATCANSVAQIALSTKLKNLQIEGQNLNADDSTLSFQEQFEARAETLRKLRFRLLADLEQIDSSLARLESLRNQAQRALGKALFLDSDSAGRVFRVNTTYRRRLNTNLERYHRARKNAVQMGFLAKRAIEQRFGVRLASLRDKMSLVDAPASWESEVCTSSGFDFDKEGRFEDDSSPDYADAFVGQYVTKLENFVESYRIDFPFNNGSDTAVVSLRDDIQNRRAVCDAPVGNLLHHAGNLQIRPVVDGASGEDGVPGWSPLGCTLGSTGQPEPNCAAVAPLTEQMDVPFVSDHPDFGQPRPFRVTFGSGPNDICAPGSLVTCPCETPACGFNSEVRYGQQIELRPGRYRLSWYAAGVGEGLGGEMAENALVVESADGSGINVLDATASTDEGTLNGYRRYWYFFEVTEGQLFTVGIQNVLSDPAVQLDVAGIMLEEVTDTVRGRIGETVAAADEPPIPFADTGATRTRPLQLCEDTDGEYFRAEGWRRNCIPLCSGGFGKKCALESAENFCFWETEFTVTQHAIERGDIFRSAGIARGNFNYRIDSIGVNFVGSAARQCADDSLPSTCFSAAFIPFSLQHVGPYTVRNHEGDDFDAPLFIGNIEHGRGLAAERYLTNPLSGSDRGLIEPYLRRELRGRPLNGTYRLRVWEEPGVNFDGIEDVQLVLNYRYWTRFN